METAKLHITGKPGAYIQCSVRCHVTLEDIRRYARLDGSIERCFWPTGHFAESDRHGMSLFTTGQSIAYRPCGGYERLICVVLQFDPSPIPCRDRDWCAYIGGREERRMEYGWGKRREEAIAGLFELFAEKDR